MDAHGNAVGGGVCLWVGVGPTLCFSFKVSHAHRMRYLTRLRAYFAAQIQIEIFSKKKKAAELIECGI
jgi:hypothetical protein